MCTMPNNYRDYNPYCAFILAAVLWLSGPSLAQAATNFCHFPTAVSTASNTGVVTVNGVIGGAPDDTLVTKNLVNNYLFGTCRTTLNNKNCKKSDTVIPAFTAVPSIPGGSNLTANYILFGSTTFSPGNYGTLTVNSSATAKFGPGDYTFSGPVIFGNGSNIEVTTSGLVRFFVNGDITVSSYANVNTNFSLLSSSEFFMYASGSIVFEIGSGLKGVAYADGNILANSSTNVTGALSAGGNVTVDNVDYSKSLVDATGYGGACVIATEVLDHVAVAVDSSASTCVPEPVSFSVNNSAGVAFTDYDGTVILSTSTGHGNWSKTDTPSDAYGTLIPGVSDSGAAIYTFSTSDNGSATLALSNGRSESLTVSALGSVAGEAGTSTDVVYGTNGFVGTDVTGGRHVVGYPHQWRVQMIQQDPVTGDCAVNASYSQTGVKAWLGRSAQDPNGAAPTLVDSVSGGSLSVPSSEPVGNNFNLTFVNGTANFTVNTTDVGIYNLYVADKTRSFADVDMAMASGIKTYGPFGFYVSATDNPAASTAEGTVYKAAGEAFRVNVSAVAWQAEDDLDGDRLPDGHHAAGVSSRANLANNPVLASFGQESPAESVTLSAALLLPAGGNNPGLKDADTLVALARTVNNFSGGSGFVERVYFDEVGIIELNAQVSDSQYVTQSAADTQQSKSYSNNIGRFSAARFAFAGSSLTEACQTGLDFSYMGQSFAGELSFTPKSARGTELQNYAGDFMKLSTGQFSFLTKDTNSGEVLTSRLSSNLNSLTFSGSTGTAAGAFTLARASAPDGPFIQLNIAADFTDSDGASLIDSDKDLDIDSDGNFDAASLGETEVRFGRLSLASAHGPETAPLSVPMLVKYWQAPDWLVNTDDSCSQIARTDIRYPNGTIDLSSNRTVTVGASSTIGSYSVIVGDAVQLIEGDSGLIFSAPGSGNIGSLTTDIDLTNYPWLRFDWNGDGDYSDSAVPDNTVNFGTYRGHDRMIFWQEY